MFTGPCRLRMDLLKARTSLLALCLLWARSRSVPSRILVPNSQSSLIGDIGPKSKDLKFIMRSMLGLKFEMRLIFIVYWMIGGSFAIFFRILWITVIYINIFFSTFSFPTGYGALFWTLFSFLFFFSFFYMAITYYIWLSES